MAEGVFKKWLTESNVPINVDSAGISAMVGRAPTRRAQAQMQARNIDISMHVAQQLSDQLVRDADLILVMEAEQKKIIETQYAYALGKVFLLGKWSAFEVPDPYAGEDADYEFALTLIDKGLADWQKKICPV